MFDVGFSELVLLFVIGLLILGPERLPRVAAQIGRWVGKARRTANQLRHQIEREMAEADIRKHMENKPKKRPSPGTPAAGVSESKTSDPQSDPKSDDASEYPADNSSTESPDNLSGAKASGQTAADSTDAGTPASPSSATDESKTKESETVARDGTSR